MTDQRDQRMRELTYRLIQMAPEAPPFPEEPVTTLKPRTTSQPRGPQRRPVAVWAAAAAFALVLLIGVPLLFLSGGGDEGPANPTTVPTTVPETTTLPPTPPVAVAFNLYYLADYVEGSNLPGPHLIPVRRNVEVVGTGDVHDQVGAAIVALLEGPTAAEAERVPGISSSIPAGTELVGFTLDNTSDTGVLTLEFNRTVESGGGTFSMTSRLAQLVYTATQFPNIDGIEIAIDGETVRTFSSEGIVLEGLQTRDGYRDLLPLIFVESPLAGDIVTSPIEISGVANTFEAGVEWDIQLADGMVLAGGFTTATCGTGCWGEFSIIAEYALEEQSAGFVVVYESSAQDGSRVNVVRIPVTLEPAEGSTEGMYTEAYGGYADGSPFGAPLNGAVVVESPITIYGYTNVTTEMIVNGAPVPVTNEAFEFPFELEPGSNEILLEDGVLNTVFTVTYLPGGERQFGFVPSGVLSDESGTIEGEDGTVYTTPVLLAVDYAQWLSGDAANQAAFEDGVIESIEDGVPNDYYIRNQNPELRSIPVRPGVTVYLIDPSLINLPVRVELATWLDLVDQGGDGSYFNAGSPTTPYWFVIDADGYIVQIVQQYVP